MDIDAVITWVDGADPAHRRKREAAKAGSGDAGRPVSNAFYETRFTDSGEVYWCIASILRFAPFVRRIHLLTDAQRPDLLDAFEAAGIAEPGRIRVVDHRDVFREHGDALPTFSSLSIEAMMHRIPDLAEFFLYFNDDFFFCDAVAPSDFVDASGRVRLRGRMRAAWWPLSKLWLRRTRRRILSDGYVEAHYKSAQAQSAARAGLRHYLQLEHHPHILRRATLEAVYDGDPGFFRSQVSHKFRHIDQLLPVGLANHTEVRQGGATVEPRPDVAYMKPRHPDLVRDSLRKVAEGVTPFGCIQSFDEMLELDPAEARTVVAVMETRLRETLPDAVRDRLRSLATG